MILAVAPNILLLLPILDIPLLLANSVPAPLHLPVRHPAVALLVSIGMVIAVLLQQRLVRLDNIGMCHRAAEPAIVRQLRPPIALPANGGIVRLALADQLLLPLLLVHQISIGMVLLVCLIHRQIQRRLVLPVSIGIVLEVLA